MSSLQERVESLERDLLADPPRISAYHDLPFTILRYDPWDEYAARKEITLLSTRLENQGRRVRFISLAELLWSAIRKTEGVEAIVAEERALGFSRAETTVSTLLTDREFLPLPDQVAKMMQHLDPVTDIVFLVRTASLAPSTYRCAKLLDELHGRTMVPVILFYPGTIEGTTNLRFMDMPERHDMGTYNYRVKIY